ncbi:LuxR C-terminal-related transcriptional regulator [Ferruginibacter paludis]|uniref:LuxR C-terminal-related transcriptional regulator n=1 Tax=Ferruginibacter paludis TaxID=1310417 RepID=UPI0025B349FF|nr:LuxR C-terminal-related transcriptional regulator [Ferruginibacter paludis]MDN3657471.1 LuxR C-terminal-related transcriptional regulator [Ferruginibacter paludis]
MQHEQFNREFNKMFKWFANDTVPDRLQLEADLYKKLWNFSLIGESYYFILNHNTLSFEYVCKEIKSVMGFDPAEFNVGFMNSRLHPNDFTWFLSLGEKLVNFFSSIPLEKLKKYKVRYDVRYRKKDGTYARILYQGLMLEHDENGGILRTLAVHTDITYLKQDGKPTLSFIGLDGEPSFVDVGLQNKFIERRDELTMREKEVLHLLIEGKLSKEIGDILNISKQTVDTHRKNMLRRNKLTNTSELIGKAIRYGWI